MDEVPGSVGTSAGFALRLGQTVFSSASLLFMSLGVEFYSYTAFWTCAGCNTEIGHGRFLNCMGAVWHPECFRCHACHQPICDYECIVDTQHPLVILGNCLFGVEVYKH